MLSDAVELAASEFDKNQTTVLCPRPLMDSSCMTDSSKVHPVQECRGNRCKSDMNVTIEEGLETSLKALQFEKGSSKELDESFSEEQRDCNDDLTNSPVTCTEDVSAISVTEMQHQITDPTGNRETFLSLFPTDTSRLHHQLLSQYSRVCKTNHGTIAGDCIIDPGKFVAPTPPPSPHTSWDEIRVKLDLNKDQVRKLNELEYEYNLQNTKTFCNLLWHPHLTNSTCNRKPNISSKNANVAKNPTVGNTSVDKNTKQEAKDRKQKTTVKNLQKPPIQNSKRRLSETKPSPLTPTPLRRIENKPILKSAVPLPVVSVNFNLPSNDSSNQAPVVKKISKPHSTLQKHTCMVGPPKESYSSVKPDIYDGIFAKENFTSILNTQVFRNQQPKDSMSTNTETNQTNGQFALSPRLNQQFSTENSGTSANISEIHSISTQCEDNRLKYSHYLASPESKSDVTNINWENSPSNDFIKRKLESLAKNAIPPKINDTNPPVCESKVTLKPKTVLDLYKKYMMEKQILPNEQNLTNSVNDLNIISSGNHLTGKFKQLETQENSQICENDNDRRSTTQTTGMSPKKQRNSYLTLHGNSTNEHSTTCQTVQKDEMAQIQGSGLEDFEERVSNVRHVSWNIPNSRYEDEITTWLDTNYTNHSSKTQIETKNTDVPKNTSLQNKVGQQDSLPTKTVSNHLNNFKNKISQNYAEKCRTPKLFETDQLHSNVDYYLNEVEKIKENLKLNPTSSEKKSLTELEDARGKMLKTLYPRRFSREATRVLSEPSSYRIDDVQPATRSGLTPTRLTESIETILKSRKVGSKTTIGEGKRVKL